MVIEGHKNVPDRIVNKAYSSLKFDKSADEEDKLVIRQHQYIAEHGNFRINTDKTEDNLICKLYINNETHVCEIPMYYDSIISEVYPYGDVKFKNVELMAVSFQQQNEWANESFYVSYWAEPVDVEEKWVKENVRILTQYYVPRELLSDVSLEEVVTDKSNNKFLAADVRNYTHCKTPNPWIKYSMGVIYENEHLAEKLFNHEYTHSDRDAYKLTPPEDMPNP